MIESDVIFGAQRGHFHLGATIAVLNNVGEIVKALASKHWMLGIKRDVLLVELGLQEEEKWTLILFPKDEHRLVVSLHEFMINERRIPSRLLTIKVQVRVANRLNFVGLLLAQLILRINVNRVLDRFHV